MIWNVFMWIFIALIAVTVSTTTFVLAKYEFNGWLCLVAWLVAIIMAIAGCFLSHRTLSGETNFIFDSLFQAIAFIVIIVIRFVMFFTNDNERIEKE